MTARLSACVIAENESRIIARCLDSLSFCDEIVLVDGGSVDDTVRVAEAHGARVIRHPSSDGGIHFNKNLAAREATGDWILSIDADEVVTAELAAEIRAAVESGAYDSYDLPRRTWFLGEWIHHSGWWPAHIVRLWRKGVTEWPLEVHRVPTPGTRLGHLTQPLEHYSYESLADWGRKVIHFAGCEAEEAWRRGERPRAIALAWRLTLQPPLVFLRKLVLLSAWRDGFRGLIIASSAAFASWLRSAMLWEILITGAHPDLGGRPGGARERKLSQ